VEHLDGFHPEHRQGDIVLADGSRLFTCTKNLRDGSRTPMLLLPGLFRVDVEGDGDVVRILMRDFTAGKLRGGPSDAAHATSQSFDGTEQVVSQFTVEPADGPVGAVRVMVTRPAADRGERFPCTVIGLMTRRAAP
jgi:hypothetical protein